MVFDLERSAEPLARCVFYCLIIIAALLLARIYWSRQAACLLNAYEAETSCSSAVTSLWSSGWFLFPRVELSIPGVCRGDRPLRRSPVCEKSTSSGKEKKHFLMKFKKLDKILIKIFNQFWSQSLYKKKQKGGKKKVFAVFHHPRCWESCFLILDFPIWERKGNLFCQVCGSLTDAGLCFFIWQFIFSKANKLFSFEPRPGLSCLLSACCPFHPLISASQNQNIWFIPGGIWPKWDGIKSWRCSIWWNLEELVDSRWPDCVSIKETHRSQWCFQWKGSK